MSKNLIYANADEFHVKSTIVYATGVGNYDLYYDEESTKPVYADELKRLFFAGGLKICYRMHGLGEGSATEPAFLSPIAFSEVNGIAIVKCLMSAGNVHEFAVPVRSASSDDGKTPFYPGVPAEETPSH